MHQALRRELRRRDDGERLEWFATAVLAEFPHGGEHVRLVNLGHPALLLRGGQVRAVEPHRRVRPARPRRRSARPRPRTPGPRPPRRRPRRRGRSRAPGGGSPGP
ncbi:SpoIIE family protein phosphatase [Streptomyces sp. PA03-3a]|nr:SpoIIE family protein phosphatase [Streptomyces sp. PA03-3a]